MKKTTKTLLTLVVILAVLVLGYVAVVFLNKDKTETGAGTETENEVEEDVTYVIDLDGVSAIKYSNGTTEMSFVQGDREWYYEADDSVILDENTIGTMTYEFQKIEAVRTIEKPDALADYGLETPSYTVELTDTEGNVVTLYIGNEVDGCYYATVGDKEVVYTISSNVVTALEFDIENLRVVEDDEIVYSEEDEEEIIDETVEDVTEDITPEEEIIEE